MQYNFRTRYQIFKFVGITIIILVILTGRIYAQPTVFYSENTLPDFHYALSGKMKNELCAYLFNSPVQENLVDSLKHELKNIIYAAASVFLIGGSLTVNYERMILHIGNKSNTHLYLRSAYGSWVGWLAGGPGGIISTNILFFGGNHHIEAGFGAGLIYNREHYEDVLEQSKIFYDIPPSKKDYMYSIPVINLGYRYMNPGMPVIFRTGLSYPEGLYAGLGFAF